LARFATFLANDAQRRNANAETAVFREADGIRTILRLSEAVVKDAESVKRASLAVAVVQLDKARPQAPALFVFTTAFATTVALIGVGERPFSSRIIDDEPLREALASASR
jgi:hypothetical protein